ncbi:hypothetical protein [Lysobacter sp. Root916]|nr:hypothetical protein [Lysobacter sp. Root916]
MARPHAADARRCLCALPDRTRATGNPGALLREFARNPRHYDRVGAEVGEAIAGFAGA